MKKITFLAYLILQGNIVKIPEGQLGIRTLGSKL